ncbi:MAG: lasso peptide biosynthesis B2 protein [Egibacteraceae bacterium]
MPVERPAPVPLQHRPAALVAVGLARMLADLPPRRIRAVLTALRRRATPSSYDQALAARDAVVATSTRCAGDGCLQRALATTLLCRLHGVWPTWCTGVRTTPFTAHAWVEADGRPVGEPHGPGYYHPIITVPPTPPDA